MAKRFLSKVKALETLKMPGATLQVCHKLGYAVVRTRALDSVFGFLFMCDQVNVRYSVACKMIQDGSVVPASQDSIGKFYRDVYKLKGVA